MIDLCNVTELKALLARHGFHFSKAKGQNFLIQSWVPERIAEEAGACGDCGVLEIGPGVGPLTQQLCLGAKKVVAIELDNNLKPILSETLADFSNLEIIWGDAMKMDLAALVAEKFQGLRPMACANLPYYITTPVLAAWCKKRWLSASPPRPAPRNTALFPYSASITPNRSCCLTCLPPASCPSPR